MGDVCGDAEMNRGGNEDMSVGGTQAGADGCPLSPKWERGSRGEGVRIEQV